MRDVLDLAKKLIETDQIFNYVVDTLRGRNSVIYFVSVPMEKLLEENIPKDNSDERANIIRQVGIPVGSTVNFIIKYDSTWDINRYKKIFKALNRMANSLEMIPHNIQFGIGKENKNEKYYMMRRQFAETLVNYEERTRHEINNGTISIIARTLMTCLFLYKQGWVYFDLHSKNVTIEPTNKRNQLCEFTIADATGNKPLKFRVNDHGYLVNLIDYEYLDSVADFDDRYYAFYMTFLRQGIHAPYNLNTVLKLIVYDFLDSYPIFNLYTIEYYIIRSIVNRILLRPRESYEKMMEFAIELCCAADRYFYAMYWPQNGTSGLGPTGGAAYIIE